LDRRGGQQKKDAYVRNLSLTRTYYPSQGMRLRGTKDIPTRAGGTNIGMMANERKGGWGWGENRPQKGKGDPIEP